MSTAPTAPAPIPPGVYNPAEVRRTLEIFCGDDPAEIRILNAYGSKSRTDCGYFDDFGRAAGMLAAYAHNPRNTGIYFVLNQFSRDLMLRASNRFQERIDSTVTDADITRRKWLFIDCDPKRPAGISSSPEEHEAAKHTAAEVARYLNSQAWPQPIICSSGNGWHLHYRIDVPENEASRNSIKLALTALHKKFSTAAVQIDTKVFNAARICKLYGTVARKGDHSENRPHRTAEIVRVPDTIHVLSWNKVEALAAEAPEEPKRSPKQAKPTTGNRPRKSVIDRARAYISKIPPAVSGESGHDRAFHVACVLVIDFSLSIEDATPLFAEWSDTCSPPWSDREILHKLQSASEAPGERGKALRDGYDPMQRFAVSDAEALAAVEAAAADPDPVAEPDHMRHHRGILEQCGIIYCAADDQSGHIEIFSETTRKFTRFKDPSGIKYEQLVLAGGQRIIQMVQRPGAETAAPFTLSQIKLAMASLAAQTSAVHEKRGVGVWESGGHLVIVSSRQLGVLNGNPLMTLTANPVFRNEAYDVGDRCEWIDMEQLQQQICSVGAQPGRLHVDDVFRLQELFSRWRYRSEDSAFPEILTGLVLASFVQTLWRWRPQVFLIGQAYAGKTTMMHALAKIFGALEANSSQSSAAGIRQALRHSGRIALCDEMEKNKHRPEIFEMIRSSGRGDEVFRGTAGQQGHLAFRLQHIFWCASIESGLLTEADSSRFIVIELQKTNQRIDIPAEEELTAMGRRLAASAICNVRRAREIADHLLSNRPEAIHGRVCESYAVPVSMYATSIGMSESEALALFLRALAGISESDQVESDAETLLQELMLAQVSLPGGVKMPLMTAVGETLTNNTAEEALEAVGVLVDGPNVLINKNLALRYLLTPDWRGKRIDQILTRITGVDRVVKRTPHSKTALRFIAIPKSRFSKLSELKTSAQDEQSTQNPFDGWKPF